MTSLTGLPFGIGSLPHLDPAAACAAILRSFPNSPFCPELPKRGWRESMGNEQARGLPGFRTDDDAKKVFFDATQDITFELEEFYQRFLDGDFDSFSVSDDFVPGFQAMAAAVAGRRPRVLKAQLTGPTTLGLILKDGGNRAVLYHEQIMDVLVKATTMKAVWMARKMADLCEQPVIFFDEPMLQSIGSAAIPIDKETAIERLKEITSGVDCLTGGHCCGNTDWSILMAAGVDVIAFDAWHFSDTLALYPSELKSFLARGGYLAWGVVPASAHGAHVGQEEINEKLTSGIAAVAKACGLSDDMLKKQSLVTPSCGLGSLSESDAEAILTKTADTAEMLA